MGKYPRVLIVNAQSIYKKNATGITLQSIWSEWDADCLLEIYSDPMVMDESNHKFKSSTCKRKSGTINQQQYKGY